jgi:small-conductance mechanosensitive channel
MLEAADLIATAAIVAAAGVVVLMFRLQRELSLNPKQRWIAWADGMMILATLSALIAVCMLLFFGKYDLQARAVAAGACLLSTVLVFGYVPAILAHHELKFTLNDNPKEQRGGRENPEPAERRIIYLFGVIALGVLILFGTHQPPTPPPTISTPPAEPAAGAHAHV